ncbi:MAG TPA: hypothetical protein VFO41_08820, partial [Alphaproteobacteria bacterium]|nr:hypothetical protein [Alphaproteobacteria bacterium]
GRVRAIRTRMILICAISGLAGCASTGAVPVDTSCSAFEPIRYSRKDTPETVTAIRAHNAAWDALCKGN